MTITTEMLGRLLRLTCFCLLALSLSPPANAQGETSPREQARVLGEEGLTKYDAGDFAGALDKLDKAYGLYPAPTLGLYSARALAKLGRLLEASRRYLEVSRATLEADASDQLRQAQADAQSEQAVLQKRIPQLRIELTGAEASEVSITLNGQPVAPSELNQSRQLDPGKYVVRGARGSETRRQEVALRESETKTAVLQFEPPPPPAPVAPTPIAPAPAPAPAPVDRGSQQSTGSSQRTLGWIVVAVGGVGVGVGVGTGLAASSKKSDLEKVCGDISRCPESARSDVDQYNNLRTASTIGFIAGGVGLAAGFTLVLTAPTAKSSEKRGGLRPFIGLGSAGVRGAF